MGVDVCVKDCDPASELAVYIGVDIVLLFYQLIVIFKNRPFRANFCACAQLPPGAHRCCATYIGKRRYVYYATFLDLP